MHYFLSYKRPPGAKSSRSVYIHDIYGRDEAVEVIKRSMEDYRELREKDEAERLLEWRELILDLMAMEAPAKPARVKARRK